MLISLTTTEGNRTRPDRQDRSRVFSVSVELSVERSFGKDGGDPAFDQMLPAPSLWSEYAAAFA